MDNINPQVVSATQQKTKMSNTETQITHSPKENNKMK